MSNTFKIERARKLNGYDKPSKDVKLIAKGKPEGLRDIITNETHEWHVDTGGVRHGNNRKMYAKLKVSKRKSERRKLNRIEIE